VLVGVSPSQVVQNDILIDETSHRPFKPLFWNLGMLESLNAFGKTKVKRLRGACEAMPAPGSFQSWKYMAFEDAGTGFGLSAAAQ